MSGAEVEAPPIIVTLAMEEPARTRFQALRDAHFPPELNRVPAHLTLFHALPGELEDEIVARAKELCAKGDPFTVEVAEVRSLGKGVAYRCASAALDQLRAALASSFADRLTRQDAQGFRAHVTVQNKVSPDKAKETHRALSRHFEPWSFQAVGLDLWRYRGGPWEELAQPRFEDA